MSKSGGYISNAAQENLATCMTEDGRTEAGTMKAFTWPRKGAWKVVCVTLPNKKFLPLKVITKLHKACSLFKLFKTVFFSLKNEKSGKFHKPPRTCQPENSWQVSYFFTDPKANTLECMRIPND